MVAAAKLTDQEIIEAMRAVGGMRSAAANRLGISPRTLSRRLEKIKTLELMDNEERNKKALVEQTILQKALKGNCNAARYWLLRTSWAPEIPRLKLRSSGR